MLGIKAIFFDWHGVLDKRNVKEMVRIVMDNRKPSISLVFKYTRLIDRFAAGSVSPDYFWSRVRNDFPRKFEKAKNYILTVEKDRNLWKILPKLKEMYALFVLSDCPSDKESIIRNEINLEKYFEKSYFSYDYGMTKKEKRFFTVPLKENNLNADECLFIDDSEKNIKLAKSVGFRTHVYRNAANLRRLLSI